MSTQPRTLKKSHIGEISVGGCRIDQLAQNFGTPLYVMDEETIRFNCQSYTTPLKTYYPNHQVIYACKANLNIPLASIMVDEGLGLDVVSGGELYTALQTSVKHEHIYFHGNNKSRSELELAIKNDIKIVVDNIDELELISMIATSDHPANLLIRLKPEIDAHTHDYIKTGQLDSKFGIDQKELINIISLIQKKNTPTHPLNFVGIHSHIGSQIFDVAPFEELVLLMVGHLNNLKNTLGIEVKELNLGGGIGIKYTSEDTPLELHSFIAKITSLLSVQCKKHNLTEPKLCLEPGRSIAGNAGLTIYRVGLIKEIPEIKSYIFVDGGMADNPRPIIYQSKYTFDVDCPKSKTEKKYSIAGKFCESGDILAEDISLPTVNKKDLIIAYGTGAYNYSMSSNYNRACRPAMISVYNGKVTEFVKRESFEDLIRLDIH